MIAEPFSFLRQPFAAAVEHKWNMEGCNTQNRFILLLDLRGQLT